MRTPAQLNWSRPDPPDDPQNQSYHSPSVRANGDTAVDDDMLDVKPDIRKLKELLQLHTSRAQANGAVPASSSPVRRSLASKPAKKTAVSPPVIRFLKPRRGSPIRRRRSDEENVAEAALRCNERLLESRSGYKDDTRPLKMPTVKVEPMDEDEAPPVLSKMVPNPVNVKDEVFDEGYGDAGRIHRQPEPHPLPVRPLQRQPQPIHRPIYHPSTRPISVIRPIPTPAREPFRFPVIHSSSHLLPPPKSGFVFSVKSAPPRQPTPPPPSPPKPKAQIKPVILKKPKPPKPAKPPKRVVLGPNGEPRKRGRPRIHPVKPKFDPPRKRGRPRKYPPGSKRPRKPPVRVARPIEALRFNSQVRDRSIDWSHYDESKAFFDKEIHVLGEKRTFKLCSSCLEALYEENINKHTLRSHFSRCRAEFKEV
uniref:C2H2-type domain-containing protein n=1 Tax=Panagrellus redivivus TaxID=6233 RepID=A0A7E4WCM6_PANRE